MSDCSEELSWQISQRWQQFDGEWRTNVLRMGSLALFYSIHLLRYLGARNDGLGSFLQLGASDSVTPEFHWKVTLLVAGWAGWSGFVHFSLTNRVFPRWLPLVSTCLDIFLLTCVLAISDGPRSPLVSGYFVILALASLRFELQLVRVATIGSMFAYIGLLGIAKWPATFGRAGDDLSVSRYYQLVTLSALLVVGVVLGQVSRRVKGIARDYALRSQAAQQTKAGEGDSSESLEHSR